ncbi:glycoside hydrolase family 31 protein [Bosea sp. NBC_00550]|uniref:glycoside hydrolase family 31 protein n=1 Tax=Bosea sp. NBC_00550 TaxID=2969621 RepID=UPI002232C7FF|nr:glycoside hydrolase family 31 protein [Bosea sp. NBC_00550]UZF92970.1 glycoside hydrolase family 31 protein [Bosea sp. NBC_00550]
MKALTQGRYLGRDGEAALFDVGLGHTLAVRILEGDIGRVTLKPQDGYRLDRGWSIAPGGLEPAYEGRPRDDLSGFTCPSAKVSTGEGWVVLSAGGLTAEVTLAPFGIAWRRDGEDKPFLQDRTTQAYLVSPRTGALAHFMARDYAERHYGLGDKAGPLDRTGRRFAIDAVDPCGFDAELSDPLYKMLPFFIVDGPVGAHGIFYDNLSTGSVDLGCTLDNYHGLFRSWKGDDGDLDYYVMAGPTVPDVVRRFSWLTGGQAFAPLWSFGFGVTSMAIADAPDADARISDFIGKLEAHRIPCDSFHFGSGYTQIGHRRYAFNWNRQKFPDPKATMQRLNDVGIFTVANLKPCLLDDHPRLQEALDDGFLVKDGKTGEPAVAQFWDGLGFHLDYTSPKGRAWWRNGIETALLDYGFTTVWNDNNEYEIWDEDAVCDGDGRPFRQALARPAQPLLMTKLSYEAQAERQPGKRQYAITRGGCAGISRYAQTWSGDNETAWKTLRYNLTQGLNMSLSGLFSIGHDVGGFHGPTPGPELFVRFNEFCSLWPRMVMNSWNDDGVVNLPWMYPEMVPQVREAISLRYRLMPYLYTLMWRASRDGTPAIRPLLWDFPQDATAVKTDDAFMLGPDVLVAPVLEEGARERSVYLPVHDGGWYDWHTGKHFAGGAVVTVAAPLGRLPVFARAGALIPLGNPEGIDDLREILVCGVVEGASGELYEDDGETSDWRGAGGAVLRFSVRDGEIETHQQGETEPRFDRIAIRHIATDGTKPGA